MNTREWEISKLDKDVAKNIAEECDLSYFLSVLLSIKGIKSKDEVFGFLEGYNKFSDPFDFIDMDKLVSRVNRAILNFEKICIYGDYDADGVTATSMMYLYFKSRGADVIYYIPDREDDGYGLNTSVIDKLNSYGVKLIFTVDNGISAFNEIKYANSLGIDTVVTDHHRPPEKLPDAIAVVDPFREDCKSEFKKFAGVGVAFKAIVALESEKSTNLNDIINNYGEFVTIGTIGDSIELIGETRDFIRKGLKIISRAKRPGIRVLLESAGLYGKQLDATNIAFGVVPKINASGRMGSADRAVKLLLAETTEDAEMIYNEINSENNLRKSIESKIMESIDSQFIKEPNRVLERIIIAEGKKWHPGVLGILSSRVMIKYGKPCVIITYDDENAKGSSRSIDGFSIHEAISSCSSVLERFGGHPMAAGLNLKKENIGKFKNLLIDYANREENIPFLKTHIDCKLNPATISEEMLYDLDRLKPFGTGNNEPIFGLYSMVLKDITSVGGGNHLKLKFVRDKAELTVMYFRKSIKRFPYCVGDTLDLAVTLNKNEYAGFISLSIYMIDLKLSSVDTNRVLTLNRLYEKFKNGKNLNKEELNLITPTRENFADIYRYIKSNKRPIYKAEIISSMINSNDINEAKVSIALDVMKELRLADISSDAGEHEIIINNMKGKVNLDSSRILRSLKEI